MLLLPGLGPPRHLLPLGMPQLSASRPDNRDSFDADFTALNAPRMLLDGGAVTLPSIGEAPRVARDGMPFGPRRLRAGQRAFHEGEPFSSLCAIGTGSFKTSMLDNDGREQVHRFCFAGDLMGLDGLGAGGHSSTATALEDSDVYSVPVTSLRDATTGNQTWHEVLTRCMGQEISRDHAQLLLVGRVGAFGRLAAFLLELSDGLQARGYSPTDFHIRMSRADIGSYLCLRLETISRVLSTLEKQGVLDVDKRHIVIHSLEKLRLLRDRDNA